MGSREFLSSFYTFGWLCTRRPCSTHYCKWWRLLHHRYRRAKESRCFCWLILRQCWIRTTRNLRCYRRASERTCLLPCLCRSWNGSFDHTFKNDIGSCAKPYVKSLLWPIRIRCKRDQHQACLVLQQRVGATWKEKDYLSLAWLPWVWLNDGIIDRPRFVSSKIRSAVTKRTSYRGSLFLQACWYGNGWATICRTLC